MIRLIRQLTAFIVIVFAGACAVSQEPSSNMRLAQWERGLLVHPIQHPEMKVYLWFYEWHMFDAVEQGQHTGGTRENQITVADVGTSGTIVSANPGIKLEMTAVRDGAEMTLTVTNRSDHDWPKLASMIACFNPGPANGRNPQFANTDTWFHSASGLEQLAIQAPREINYNHSLRHDIDAAADGDGRYAWSDKWPKSDVDAIDGLIVRRSTNRKWVTAIAWERFLSAQGHNPWECMHLSVNVGPLKQGETRTVRGKIYLFEGSRKDALERYKEDFLSGPRK